MVKRRVILPKLCECGKCDLFAKPGNRFIAGHNRRGVQQSVESNKKRSISLIGKSSSRKGTGKSKPPPQPCQCGCGEMVLRRFKQGHHRRGVSHAGELNPFYGSHHSEETKQKLRKPQSEEAKENMRQSHIGVPLSKEHRASISKVTKGSNNPMYGQHHKKESIEKMSISTKKSFEINGHPRQGVHHKKESIEKLSVAQSRLWKDEKYIEMLRIALNMKPNKPETLLINLLNEMFPGEYKYTGDFSFWINGKNPDFVNCNSQKKVIEFNGDYWHKDDISGEREKIFAEFGYDTLILSDKDLLDVNALKIKLGMFHEKVNRYSIHEKHITQGYDSRRITCLKKKLLFNDS